MVQLNFAGLLYAATLAQTRQPGPGPRYIETNMERFIVEPWNTASALLFLGLFAFWLIRLRGQYGRHLFIACCLPLLLTGGVGGTVYHAFRGHGVWLMMDWMPIAVLCISVAVYLWGRLLSRWWYALLIIPAVFVFQTINFQVVFRYSRNLAISVTYSMMGLLIVLPAVLVLRKNRWQNGLYPLVGLLLFIMAILCRTIDAQAVQTRDSGIEHWAVRFLPMGTHFLWHVFGAGAAHMVTAYLYRLPPKRLHAREFEKSD